MSEQRFADLKLSVLGEIARIELEMAESQYEVWQYDAELYCQSEIEKLFLIGFRAYQAMDLINRSFGYKLEIVPPRNCKAILSDTCQIPFENVLAQSYLASRFARSKALKIDYLWPQQPIGSYVADFAICRAEYAISGASDLRHGVSVNEEVVGLSLPVIIECDGHDYHERTKEQAQHDRQRDRYMQSCGYRVFRFTGSELYRDPLKCAQELDEFLRAFSAAVLRWIGGRISSGDLRFWGGRMVVIPSRLGQAWRIKKPAN